MVQLAVVVPIMTGCLSLGSAPSSRDIDADLALKRTLGSSVNLPCRRIIRPTWNLGASSKNFKLLSHAGENVMVYEVPTPRATRTVWQPLNSEFEFSEPGVLIGDGQHPHVIDFQIEKDKLGNYWTTYRGKRQGSQAYDSIIEFVNVRQKNQLSRFYPSLPGGHSVQKIWMLQPPQTAKGIQHSNPQADVISFVIKAYDLSDMTAVGASYFWFRVPLQANVQNSQPLAVTTRYFDRDNTFEQIDFVYGPGGEPIALAVAQTGGGSSFTANGSPMSRPQIFLQRIFHPRDAAKTTLVFESRLGVISGLTAHLEQLGQRVALSAAWIQENPAAEKTWVQWITFPFFIDENFLKLLFAKKSLAALPSLPQFQDYRPLQNLPSDLQFRTIRGRNDEVLRVQLDWFATLDEDIALQTTQVFPILTADIPEKKGQSPWLSFLVDETDIRPLGFGTLDHPEGAVQIIYTSRTVKPNAPFQSQLRPRICIFESTEIQEEKGEI